MNARRAYLISEEATKIKHSLGAMTETEYRCITAVAKRILLDGPYFYEGKHINPVAKSIGAGVWIVFHKKETSQ